MVKCGCFFCLTGKKHTYRHTQWYSIGSDLKPGKDESLNPADRLPDLEACATCGHKRVKCDVGIE